MAALVYATPPNEIFILEPEGWNQIQENDLRRHQLEASNRRLFAQMIVDNKVLESVLADPMRFYELLREVAKREWVHFSQVAREMNYSPAQVHRWFRASTKNDNKPTPPHWAIMKATLEVISRLLLEDVERLQGTLPENPLAGQPVPRQAASN